MDRAAPDQQREFARIVDAYYAGWVQVNKEQDAARGNPIQEQKVELHLSDVKVKLWDNLAALMRKTDGKFDSWIGTLSFAQAGSYGVDNVRANLVFAPDGILSRSMINGEPLDNAPALILFRAFLYQPTQGGTFEDTRPLMSSPFVQSLGAVDVKKKVRASGQLIMTGYPPSTCTAAGKLIAFHCAESGAVDGFPPYPIVARFTAISNK